MKRVLTALSVMLVMAMLILPVTASAEPVAGEHTIVDGDVTYTVSTYEDGTAYIYDILIAETVTEPIDLVIPASFTIDGETYTVSSVYAISQWKTGADEESYDQYEKIKSVSFEAEELPVINGNLFQFQKNTSSTTYFPGEPTNGSVADKAYPTIPGFVSNNYNHDSNGDGTNDTYYAGENLVRVDPAYEGDFDVKDGTVSILAGAFWSCEGLGAVTIPDSVEWIGINAFAHSSVTSVNIPLGLMNEGNRIEPWTFQNCEKLTTVTFPENTEAKIELAYFSFAGCESLEGFDFTHVSKIETCAFAYAFAEGTEIDLGDAGYFYTYPYGDEIQYTYYPATFFASGIGKVTLPTGAAQVPTWTFMNCEHLTEVIIPDNIAMIMRSAFENCTGLAGDVLANTKVSFIDYRAFANNAMTELTIPETVTGIAGGAFAGNEQLETLNWNAGNLNSSLFSILNDCTGVNYYPTPYAPARSTDTWAEYTGLKTLNIYAFPANPSVFNGLEFVETVNFLCDVTALNSGNFKFCPSLKTVTFSAPEKLTFIGDNVFDGCLSLQDFPFEEIVNVTRIGSSAFLLSNFYDGRNYHAVNASYYATLSDEQKSWGLTGEVDLSACTKLESLGSGAFYNQHNVTKVHLPESLIGWPSTGAFQGMANLKELILEGDAPINLFSGHFFAGERTADKNTLHDTLETVTIKGQAPAAAGAFFGMPKLKTVNLPNATSIPGTAFMNCTALTTVNAPAVTDIGANAFMNCTALTSFTLKAGVTYGSHLFMNCTGLTEVIAEEGVTVIPEGAFMNCTALTSVTAPDVTEIQRMAFANTGLTELVIKADVIYGTHAFQNCAQLTTVVVEEGVTELPDFILEGTTGLEELSLPETLESIGWAALKNSGLERVCVPASVEVIHDDAFRGSAQAVVLEGAPYIRSRHLSGYEDQMLEVENDQHAIDGSATIYYANDEAKTAAETYAVSVSILDLAIEPYGSLVLEAQLDLEKLLVGEALTGLTVTLNGEALTAEQYSVDYDPTDATLGQRLITVTLTDETLKNNSVIPGQASATGFDGEAVSGKIVSVTDADSISDTVTVNVVDHLEHIFDIPGDELAKAATCTAPAEYYAECSFEGCDVCSDTITLPKGEVDPDNHTGGMIWGCNPLTHTKMYECCGAPVESSEGPHDWTEGICKECKYECSHSPNSDGSCTACGYQYAASVTTADGETTFYTMPDARDAANANSGSTLKLLKDISAKDMAPSSILELNGNYTLDLGGMTLGLRVLVKGGTLTIVDTAEEKGTIVNDGGTAIVYSDGKVIIDASVDCLGEAENHTAWCFNVHTSGKPGIIGTTGTEDIVLPQGCVMLDIYMQEELSVLSSHAIIHRHADENTDHICDNRCKMRLGDHIDENTDHNCDYGCDEPIGDHEATESSHNCEYCGKPASDCADTNKDGKCDICGELLAIIRLAGANRWNTALKVADEMKANLGAERFDAIIIASGNGFADALAGSYLSTVKDAPILLSWGQGGKFEYLDTDNIDYIKENLAEDGVVYLLGGVSAVPELYETELADYDVVRLGGKDRFETNLLILEEAGVADGAEILVCTSTNFADSLSASATGMPILLVFNEQGVLYGDQPEFLAGLKNCTFTVIGGESAVSAKLATAIEAYGEVTRLAGTNRFETSVLVAQKYFEAPETAVLAYAWNYPDGLCGGALAYTLGAPLILTMTNYEDAAVEYATDTGITTGIVLGGDTLISDEAVRAIFAMDAEDEIVVK